MLTDSPAEPGPSAGALLAQSTPSSLAARHRGACTQRSGSTMSTWRVACGLCGLLGITAKESERAQEQTDEGGVSKMSL